MALLVLGSLSAIGPALPDPYSRPLFAEPSLGLEVDWVRPLALLGLALSFWLRRSPLRMWRGLMMLCASLQAGYWCWGLLVDRSQLFASIAAGWTGLVLCQSLCANSQRSYAVLESSSLVLLLLAGYQQSGAHYSELLALALAVLVLSRLAGSASPTGVADVYVNTGFPTVDHTLRTAVFLMVSVALLSWPVSILLPHLDAQQRTFLKSFAQLYLPRPTAPEPDPPPPGRLSRRARRVHLSTVVAPAPQGEVLFAAQGPAAARWRSRVLSFYDGRSWGAGSDRLEPIVVSRAEGRAILGRREGARVNTSEPWTYRVHVLSDLGPYLVRPTGAFQIVLPGRRLLRDGRGNVLVHPRISPPLTYTVHVPSRSGGLRSSAAGRDSSVHQEQIALPAVPERVVALARSLRARAPTDGAAIQAITADLQKRCRYELVPYRIPAAMDATEYFLFEKRTGWCVHFASALAVLCRAAGIPARVVTGFGPGTFNTLTQSFTITDRDAHAWVEARPDGRAWEEYDPTPAAESPLQRPPADLGGAGTILADINAQVGSTHGTIGSWASGVVKECRARPAWLLLLLPCGLLVLGVLYRVRRREQMEFTAARWEDVRSGTPRSAARSAYQLVAAHLERSGYGEQEYTSPGEYLRALRRDGNPASNAFAFVLASYESTAFGPEVTMRWDRRRLIRSCETVLRSLGGVARARNWLARGLPQAPGTPTTSFLRVQMRASRADARHDEEAYREYGDES